MRRRILPQKLYPRAMKIVVCLIVYLTSLGVACAEYALSAADMIKSYSNHYLDYDVEYRSWTARVGSQASVEGKLLEYDKKSGKIKLKLKNGKEVEVKESQLVNYNILYLKLNYPNGLALPEFREWQCRDYSESKKTITAKLIKSEHVDFTESSDASVVIQDANGGVFKIAARGVDLKYLKDNYPNGFGDELKEGRRGIKIHQYPEFSSWNKSAIRTRLFVFELVHHEGESGFSGIGNFGFIKVYESGMRDFISMLDSALNRIAQNPNESFVLVKSRPESLDLSYSEGVVHIYRRKKVSDTRNDSIFAVDWSPKYLFELLIYMRKFNTTLWDIEQKKLDEQKNPDEVIFG